MKQNLQRNIAMTFRVTEKERDLIHKAQKESGIVNRTYYLLKMATSGIIVNLDFESIREMNRLLGNATNNINQIARRVNEKGNIYAADMEEIRARQGEIIMQQKEILRRLDKIHDLKIK